MPDTLNPNDLPEVEARAAFPGARRPLWERLRFYASFLWRFVVL